MQQVKIGEEDIRLMVAQVKKSATALKKDIKDIDPPQKSRGIMVEKYFAEYIKISVLLERYIDLLNADMDDILNATNNFIEMDNTMRKMY